MKNNLLLLFVFFILTTISALNNENNKKNQYNFVNYYKSLKPIDIPVHVIYDEQQNLGRNNQPILSKIKNVERQRPKMIDVANKESTIMEIYVKPEDERRDVNISESLVKTSTEKISSINNNNLLRLSEDHIAQVSPMKAVEDDVDVTVFKQAAQSESNNDSISVNQQSTAPPNLVANIQQAFSSAIENIRPVNVAQAVINRFNPNGTQSTAASNSSTENTPQQTTTQPGLAANLQQAFSSAIESIRPVNVAQAVINRFNPNATQSVNNSSSPSAAGQVPANTPPNIASNIQQAFTNVIENIRPVFNRFNPSTNSSQPNAVPVQVNSSELLTNEEQQNVSPSSVTDTSVSSSQAQTQTSTSVSPQVSTPASTPAALSNTIFGNIQQSFLNILNRFTNQNNPPNTKSSNFLAADSPTDDIQTIEFTNNDVSTTTEHPQLILNPQYLQWGANHSISTFRDTVNRVINRVRPNTIETDADKAQTTIYDTLQTTFNDRLDRFQANVTNSIIRYFIQQATTGENQINIFQSIQTNLNDFVQSTGWGNVSSPVEQNSTDKEATSTSQTDQWSQIQTAISDGFDKFVTNINDTFNVQPGKIQIKKVEEIKQNNPSPFEQFVNIFQQSTTPKPGGVQNDEQINQQQNQNPFQQFVNFFQPSTTPNPSGAQNDEQINQQQNQNPFQQFVNFFQPSTTLQPGGAQNDEQINQQQNQNPFQQFVNFFQSSTTPKPSGAQNDEQNNQQNGPFQQIQNFCPPLNNNQNFSNIPMQPPSFGNYAPSSSNFVMIPHGQQSGGSGTQADDPGNNQGNQNPIILFIPNNQFPNQQGGSNNGQSNYFTFMQIPNNNIPGLSQNSSGQYSDTMTNQGFDNFGGSQLPIQNQFGNIYMFMPQQNGTNLPTGIPGNLNSGQNPINSNQNFIPSQSNNFNPTQVNGIITQTNSSGVPIPGQNQISNPFPSQLPNQQSIPIISNSTDQSQLQNLMLGGQQVPTNIPGGSNSTNSIYPIQQTNNFIPSQIVQQGNFVNANNLGTNSDSKTPIKSV